MSRKPKEAVVIIIDAGHHDGDKGCASTFLEKTRTCVSMILKRKIFSMPNDEVSIVVVGSKDTKNSLDYANIEEAFPLSTASFDMVRFIEDKLKAGTADTDWLDGVIVAMNLLKEQTGEKTFLERKLVLFTDLKGPVSDDQVDVIIRGIKNEELRLIIIGPHMNVNITEDEVMECNTNGIKNEEVKNENETQGAAVLRTILNEVGGVICSFEEAIPQLIYFRRKTVRPTPWNIVMDIGTTVRINVSGYKKIAHVAAPTWKTTSAPTSKTTSSTEVGTRVIKESTFYKQDEEQTPVEATDVIEAYKFGSTIVPFSEVDKSMMKYNSGAKCLSVLGFTRKALIPCHLLSGEGVIYFVPRKGDQYAALALTALIQALDELDMVAIVRRVYIYNSAPKIGALFPKKSKAQNKMCLVYIQLPFAEDMRDCYFAPLLTKTDMPTQEQLDSIDALIDNMDLTSVRNEDGEVAERFHPKRMLDPHHQHLYQCLAHRALHPEEEMPEVHDSVKDLLKHPFKDKKGFNMALEGVKRQFKLEKVKQKSKKKKTAAEEFKLKPDASSNTGPSDMNLNDLSVAGIVGKDILEIGTIKPHEDFQVLLERGEPFKEVCRQMKNVIQKLVLHSFGTDSFEKASLALETLRASTSEKDPELFNDWISDFREYLFEAGKTSFWELIVQKKLGLISSQESEKSKISEEAAEFFLAFKQSKKEEEVDPDAMDAEDLFNEM